MKFVALDFETSGLQPGTHAPVELGCALFEDGNVLSEFRTLIAPPVYKDRISRAYDVVALEISGLSWKAIKSAPTPRQVCTDLLAWANENDARDLIVVAFNAPFDFAWYSDLLFLGGAWNNQSKRFETFQPPFTGPWHCARLLAVRNLDLNSYTLDAVAAHFDLRRHSALHGALEDAALAGHVYSCLYPTVKVTP